MKKHLLFTVASLVFTTVSVHAQVQEHNFAGVEQGSILMCKDNQCVPTSSEMVRDYLYNQVNDLMTANIGQKLVLCEADPEEHKCTQKGISFPVQSQTIQTMIKIDQAQVIDAKSVKDKPDGVDVIVDYHVRAGDTFPRCQTSLTRIGIASAVDMKMMSPQFNCRLTETGKTKFSIVYNVEYLDMDTGTIGAFYTIDANNALKGSNGGYLLMKLAKGLELEAGEIFPYPAQLKAIQNGTMPPINDPEMLKQMGAFWLKPTPFLNLTTPLFAPNNCFEFEGGCSAEMLNEPKKAVPPAAEKIAELIPEGVPTTVGLIQQTVTYEDPKAPVMQKTVISNRQVIENGKAVFEEKETKHYIQKTIDSEVIEETEKATKETIGNAEDVIPDIMMKNAEKEYNSLKQFEAQTEETVVGQVTTVNGQDIQIPARTIEQTQNQNVNNVKPSNIQIIAPEGVVLSEAERAYIEKIALADEKMNATVPPQNVLIQEPVVPQQNVNMDINTVSAVPQYVPNTVNQGNVLEVQNVVENQQQMMMPVVQISQDGYIESVGQIAQIQSTQTVTSVVENSQGANPVYPVGEVTVENVGGVEAYPLVGGQPVIQPEPQVVKQENETTWQKLRKGINKFLYF